MSVTASTESLRGKGSANKAWIRCAMVNSDGPTNAINECNGELISADSRHDKSFAAEGVLDDLALAIEQLEARLETLAGKARALIAQEPTLNARYVLLLGVKGVGETSAIALLGELALAPPHLTHKQWVKWAGLNPSAFQSGKSIDKKARLSKAGNRYIRQALYMPALSARTHDPHVRAYAEHLIKNGKLPMQAICAVMRKLLHAIHGMFKDNQPFDNTRFYDLKTANIAGQ